MRAMRTSSMPSLAIRSTAAPRMRSRAPSATTALGHASSPRSARILSANQPTAASRPDSGPGSQPRLSSPAWTFCDQVHVLLPDQLVHLAVEVLGQPRAHRGVGMAVEHRGVARGPRAVGVELPDPDLIGVEVDRGVGIDEDVAPHAPVLLGQARHRRDEALVGALHQVARRLVAQRRVEPGVAVVQLDLVVLVVVAAASAPGGRSARGSPRGSCRRRSSSWPAGCRPCGSSRHQALDAVLGEPLRQARHLLGERLGVDVEVDEDEAAERLDARREEAERRLVESGIERASGTPIRSPSSR